MPNERPRIRLSGNLSATVIRGCRVHLGFASETASDPKIRLTDGFKVMSLELDDETLHVPVEDDAELDALVHEIFDIIPSYYEEDRSASIKRIIREYVIRKIQQGE